MPLSRERIERIGRAAVIGFALTILAFASGVAAIVWRIV